MGKRSKARNVTNDDSNISEKKSKIKKNSSKDLEVSNIEDTGIFVSPTVERKAKKATEIVSVKSKSKKSKKSKTIKLITDDSQEEINKNIAATVEKKAEKSKDIVNDNPKSKKSGKSKKIVFVNDEPHEIPATSGKTNNDNKKKNIMNAEEAEVKDEDIDKFCDELDEKDNKQYEDWVKLIEANFHSNKKT